MGRKLGIAALGLLLAHFSFCYAQTSSARLEGTAQDQSGAVVPGAKAVAVNLNTQNQTQALADEDGHFVITGLQPGLYKLSVEAPGFRTTVLPSIEVTVASTISQVVTLEVGSTSESVVVEATVVNVQTTESQISNAVMLRDIEALPQLGRNPLTLAIFQPGVQIDIRAGQDSSFSRVNGLRQGSNNAKLDGIDVNDAVVPRLGLALTATNSDAVGEFRVVTAGGKAEYGRNAGGQVEMITRSGTNQYHGTAYDFLRNTVLNANDFFNNQSGGTVPKFIQNLFGASFGGPIIRNKFFIFGNYQGNRTKQEVIRNRTVLTDEARNGIYRWRASAGAPIQSFNIPQADPRGIGIDPEIKKIMALYPSANNTDVGDGLNTAGFRFNNPVENVNDQFTIKGDYRLNDNNSFFMRWSWFRTSSTDNLNNADATYPGQAQGAQGGHRWGYAIGWNSTLTPSLLNEFVIGHQSATADFLRPGRIAGPTWISNLYNPDIFNSAFGQGRNSPVNDITENITKVKGSHTFKAGASLRFVLQYGYNLAGVYPNVTTGIGNGNTVPSSIGPTGLTSAQRSTFDQLYNDVLGRVDRVVQTFYSDLTKFLPSGAPKVRNFLARESGYFFQDDWRVTRKLTLNLGLRYEYFGVPHERDGFQGSIDQAAIVDLGHTSTNLTIVPKGPLYKADWNNFAPRVGFAFDPKGDGKMAIRGQWGIFYDRAIGAVYNTIDNNTPGFSQQVQVFPNQAAGNDFRYSEKFPMPAQPSAPVLTLGTTRSTSLVLANPNLRTGYVNSYSFSVQRELFTSMLIQASYVGNRGIKLFMDQDVNQPRIYGQFQTDFREMQAFAANSSSPVSANNVFVKLYGTPQAAVTAVGATNLAQGRVGTIVNTMDVSGQARFANAGVPITYFRNFPQFNQVVLGTNNGRSYYDSLQISFSKRTGALQFFSHYTWSKSMDNLSLEGNGFTTPIDNYNLGINRARADFDRPHSFNMSAFYSVPFGKGKRWGGSMPRLLDTAIGGWQVGMLQIAQSGQPFSVNSQRLTVAVSGVPAAGAYANYNGTDRSIGAVSRKGNGVYYFTPDEVARFSFPGAFEIGNAGRNVFRNPAFFETDASLVKKFAITERHAIHFRAEAYNLFNHPNFGLAAANLNLNNAASFGKFSQTIGTQTSSGSARIMQLALRYEF